MIKTKHTWRRTSNVGVMTTTGNKEHGLWLPGIEYLKMEVKRDWKFADTCFYLKPWVIYEVKRFREVLRQHSQPCVSEAY